MMKKKNERKEKIERRRKIKELKRIREDAVVSIRLIDKKLQLEENDFIIELYEKSKQKYELLISMVDEKIISLI